MPFQETHMEPCVTVTEVRLLAGYRLELAFSDGLRGEVGLGARIVGRGDVFQPLEDPAFFRKVCVDAELGTIVWPNDVDICPDLLHSLATGRPLHEAASSAP
jgi:hypothetical protein